MKHKAVRKTVRKFAETELGPISHQIDRDSRFPWEVVEKMRPLNYFGLQVPKEYGGAELENGDYVVIALHKVEDGAVGGLGEGQREQLDNQLRGQLAIGEFNAVVGELRAASDVELIND